MGYSRFRGDEEDLMRVFLREQKVIKKDIAKDHPSDLKSLLRKKMINCKSNFCSITDRGKSAITQSLKTGEYWVAPLKPKIWSPYGKAKISKELLGYIK